MKLLDSRHSRFTSVVIAALLPAILYGAPAHASTPAETSSTPAQRGRLADEDTAKPQTIYDATLFATWGSVTNGNSSANAAEHRNELTGGHAGSANAAEAPAFATTRR